MWDLALVLLTAYVGCFAVGVAGSVARDAWTRFREARRERDTLLRNAPGAVVSIALARERLREGATHAYVRGVAHVEDGTLFVRDATGVARIALGAAEIWRPTPLGFRRAESVDPGATVVACGPASDRGHEPNGPRAIDAVIELFREDRDHPVVLVAR